MKRNLKNLVMLLLIIVMLGLIFFTMYYAKNHVSSNGDVQNMNGGEVNMGQEPPEKPDDNNNNNTSNPPEKPEGEDNDTSIDNSGNEKMNGGENNMPLNNNSMNLSYVYYIAFGIESFILTIILIYLIMSKFNKKTFKETFSSSDKALIYVLVIIILTSGFTFLDSYITRKYMLNSTGNLATGINNSNSSVSYSASSEITEDTTLTSGEYNSKTKDENALLVSGKINATLSNISVTKTGDSDNGDNTSFYGTNSAIIAKDGANLVLKNITVTTNAVGANGVFSYGGSATTNNSSSDGTTITISDSKITTSKDNSGGIMTTGGGIMNASNLTITTAGISSAAIRTDRGGGDVNVDGGTYTTTGQGSPTIYSTANVTVSNSKLISKVSEGIVIEGANKVVIENCNLNDSNTKLNGKSTTYKNIFLYQSMSGDASNGKSEFTSKDSKITTNNGDTFYVTNTTASISLENNVITNNDSKGNFLRVQKDSWGNSGSNGGEVSLIMTNQKATGNIVIDSISTLDMSMKSDSYYEGTINGDKTAKSIKLSLDKTSKIKLTGDSYITSLENADLSNGNIDFNGYKLYVNGSAIN